MIATFLVNLKILASAYGEGVYGAGVYSEGEAAASNGGGLAPTGMWIIAIITLACLIIFVALLARYLGRKNRKYKRR
jgi:hypothetical protein